MDPSIFSELCERNVKSRPSVQHFSKKKFVFLVVVVRGTVFKFPVLPSLLVLLSRAYIQTRGERAMSCDGIRDSDATVANKVIK